MPLSSKHGLPCIFLCLLLILCACTTQIKTNITQNPPPTKKFSEYSKITVLSVKLVPPYAGQHANERALAKIQANIDKRLNLLLPAWNNNPNRSEARGSLIIEPVITEIKFIDGNARFWVGSLAGSSAAILKVRITEQETGNVIAAPTFYARAFAEAGMWSFGATDNLMLTRIAGQFTDYIVNNYAAAIGGPSGAVQHK